MATEIGQSSGNFQKVLFDALGTDDGSIHGLKIPSHQISNLFGEIVTKIHGVIEQADVLHLPGVDELNLYLQQYLDQKTQHNSTFSPYLDLCLSDGAQALLDYMCQKYSALSTFIYGDELKGVQMDDLSTKLFSAKNLESRTEQVDVYSLLKELLYNQGMCIVTEAEKQNPDLPSCGLYSAITVENFREVLQSQGAELLTVRNKKECFGTCVYHQKGACATEDREFFDRALKALSDNKQLMVENFGEAFDPLSCASTYGVFISPKIKGKASDGGGETSRSVAYDAFIYRMLREYAQDINPPKWVMGWVRTYPNPNIAEKAHELRGFFDTGIELPYDPTKPDGMRLKLLVMNLDQIPIHGKFANQFATENYDTPYFREYIEKNFPRIKQSAFKIRFNNWDSE